MDLGPLRPYTWALALGLLVPVSWILDLVLGAGVLVFVVTGIAIVPLAWFLGLATEELGKHAGPGIGGLLNATFGNATELIIAIFALASGLTEVVKASLTGSIIGNLLLVLGASMLAGGGRRELPHLAGDQRGHRRDPSPRVRTGPPVLVADSQGHLQSRHRGRGAPAMVEIARRGSPPRLHRAGCGRERDPRRLVGSGEGESRPHRSVRRRHHRRNRRQRGRARERGPDGASEQDGAQRGRGDDIVDAGRALRSAHPRVHLASLREADDPRLRDFRARVPRPLDRRRGRGGVRRPQQLVRRRVARHGVCGDCGGVLLPSGVRVWPSPAGTLPTASRRTSSCWASSRSSPTSAAK